MTRVLRCCGLSLLLAVIALVAGASAASAHATIVTSSPTNGEVLADVPSQVSVEFSEAVTLGAGYLRVLDDRGERVDTGNVSVAGGTVTVTLPGDLADGGYIATYRVVSADSHPVAGAISFAVGDAAPPQIDSKGTQIAGSSDDAAVAVLYPATRWIGYAGLALLAGALLMVLIDPALRADRSLRRWAWVGFDAALGATLLGALLQGPYASGRGLGSLLDPALVSATLETQAGRMAAVRLILLGVLGVLLWEWLSAERDKRLLAWAGAAAVLASAATYSASGHAVADPQPWMTIAAGAVHFTAAAAWVGGLVLLLIVVLRPQAALSQGEQSAVGRRFSAVAGWLVIVIIATGVAQAWIRVGSWGALVETGYGRLLLAKSALLAVALGAALLSRRSVVSAVSGRSIRRPVLVEAAAGTLAIAVAAVLVATPPARDTYQVARDTQISFDNGYRAQASLDPARRGSNVLHVYLFDRANALAGEIEDVTVTVRNDVRQIGPLELDARDVGQGHFIATGVQLPAAGRWIVSVTFTEPGFGAVTAEGTIDVG